MSLNRIRPGVVAPGYGRVAIVWLSGRIEIAELPVERVDTLGQPQYVVGGVGRWLTLAGAVGLPASARAAYRYAARPGCHPGHTRVSRVPRKARG
jgi:hypothetical protein